MDRKFETLIDNSMESFLSEGLEVNGLLVCDKNGLAITSRDVTNQPGPIARLAELAASLSGRKTTICLEDSENQVLIHQADKAVFAVYTKAAN